MVERFALARSNAYVEELCEGRQFLLGWRGKVPVGEGFFGVIARVAAAVAAQDLRGVVSGIEADADEVGFGVGGGVGSQSLVDLGEVTAHARAEIGELAPGVDEGNKDDLALELGEMNRAVALVEQGKVGDSVTGRGDVVLDGRLVVGAPLSDDDDIVELWIEVACGVLLGSKARGDAVAGVEFAEDRGVFDLVRHGHGLHKAGNSFVVQSDVRGVGRDDLAADAKGLGRRRCGRSCGLAAAGKRCKGAQDDKQFAEDGKAHTSMILAWAKQRIFQRTRAYNRSMDAAVREPIAAEVVSALEQGAVVLTANQRAGQSLRRGFDQKRRAQGLTSWQPPMILAWDVWIATLWRQRVIAGEAAELLLNRTQEHAVWHGILEADDDLASLRTRDSLAEMAADAWARLCRFNGHERLRETAGFSTDTRSFQRWARAFERRCREDGLLARAQLENVLQQAVASGEIALPEGGVTLVGFDNMTPSQHALIEAVRKRGVIVSELAPARIAGRRVLVEVDDEREELDAAARWVRGVLEEQPEARVAVLVPSLEAECAGIDRVFREVLAQEIEDIRAENAPPYEFSLGVTLVDVPIVATAFNLLRWIGNALPLERVSALLLSPYFASGQDRTVRAEFDAFELRHTRMLRPEVSLEKMISLIERSPRRERLPELHETLRRMQRIIQRWFGSQTRLHAEWADAMRELLAEASWGAGEAENSTEFQVRERWESVLDELATLGFDGGRVEFAEALGRLERIAQQTAFVLESRNAPVQVMGPHEAVGEVFDAVWFLRASDLQWPIAMNPSPLLPWAMQKELGMPGTEAAHDAAQATRLTEWIAASAPQVVFSYAKESSSGRQRESSALAGVTLEHVAIKDLVAAKVEQAVTPLEEVADAEPIAPPPDRVVRGGARVLQLQAACGFRAFADLRLAAAELESVELGMDAAERGNVVHKALEVFWNAVKSQSALNAMTDAEREEGLNWAINEALHKTAELSETAWDAEFIDMQRERLQMLLRPWLELEQSRPPFEVKLNEEPFDDVKVGPLRLNVRVDRVDAGEHGEIIIDYKTGAAAPRDWLTERPDAPQLPLYAILSQAPVLEAVAFAQVRAGKDMGLQGFATDKDTLAKTAKLPAGIATLEAQVEEWRRVLTTLAEDFYRGDTRVRPKKYPTTCMHCGQRLICRLDVTKRTDEGDDTDSEVAGG